LKAKEKGWDVSIVMIHVMIVTCLWP
jgi:hypothetical protein